MDTKDATKEETRSIHEEPTPGCYVKARHVIALMMFLGTFNVYSIRNNLSVAIVAMVNSTTEEDESNSSELICEDRGSSEIDDVSSNGIFNWNSAEQGLLLGCYFYGYIITCIPGGYLAKRFGVRPVFGISMFLSSIITLFTPLIARSSFGLFVAFRIVLGFLQGISFPAIQSAWGKWAPPLERSHLVSISFSGSSFGTFIILPIAGVISDNLGWEAVFYFTGGLAMLWSIVWLAIIHSSPEVHPRISEQEKVYIVESIGLKKKDENVKLRTPWLAMVRSLPLWGIMIGHFTSNWGNYTLMTMLPTYMATILRFNLSADIEIDLKYIKNSTMQLQASVPSIRNIATAQNSDQLSRPQRVFTARTEFTSVFKALSTIQNSGSLSSLPYILQFLFTIGGGYFTDVIRRRHLMSTIAIRKVNTTLGLVIPAIFVVLAGYVGCDYKAAVAFFSISVAFNALTVPGCKANTIDIAPKYGGITYGISNTLANIPGFLAPQVVGLMLLDDNSITQWQTVFWMSAGIYVFGAIFYLIVGSGEEQSWAAGKVIKRATDSSDIVFENEGVVEEVKF